MPRLAWESSFQQFSSALFVTAGTVFSVACNIFAVKKRLVMINSDLSVSVVIPTFNCAKYICEAVNSVRAQTHSPLEIIVVNDGSEDNTLERLLSITDSRLRIKSIVHSGQSAARNYGARIARGTLIAFLDADDLWHPNMLRENIKALKKHKDVQMSFSESIAGEFPRTPQEEPAQYEIVPYERLIVTNVLGNGSCAVMYKTCFLAAGRFDESRFFAEDWDIYIRIAAQFQIVKIHKPLTFYRYRLDSQSKNLAGMEDGLLTLIDKVYKTVPSQLQPLRDQCLLSITSYLMGSYGNLERSKLERSAFLARIFWEAVKSKRLSPRIYAYLFARQMLLLIPSPLKTLLLSIYAK